MTPRADAGMTHGAPPTKHAITHALTPATKWSVRSLLMVLVLACLIPAALGAVALFVYLLQEGRAQLEKDTILTAHALTQTFDGELVKAQVVAEALATSSFLERQDLPGLHRRARELLKKEATGYNVVLSDAHAHMVLNTLRPFGAPLPQHGNPAQIRRIFETGQPAISNVFIGAISGSPNFSVDVPVLSGGKVIYVLSVAIVPQQLLKLIGRQRFPGDWITSIFDRTGVVIARSRLQEKSGGAMANPALLQRLNGAPEGAFESVTREGIPSLIIFSRSPISNWTVAIAIPRKKLEAELKHNIFLLALGVAALLGLGGALAWFMGGRIARSVTALTGPALALQAGELVLPPQVYFREADEVAQAMMQTARILTQRTAERERAMLALHSSDTARVAEALFTEQLLAQLPIGVAMRNQNGDFIDANPAFLRILGTTREQLPGLANADVTPAEFAALDAAQTGILKASGSYGPYEKEYVRRDGSRVPVQVRGQFVQIAGQTRLLSVAEDISARRKAEFLQAQSQKMDAIGQLTGGLAHDFNNMLGVIIGNLDLLATDVAGNSAALAKLNTALSAALNGADLTRALLSVARAHAVKCEPINLNARLNELLPLIRHTAGNNIEVVMTPSDAAIVEGDPGSLASTVLNLVINARDAMPSGGRLTINTGLRTVAIDEKALHVRAGDYAALSISDTGTGMSAEVMAQAVTPFFTTKERGRGTGLGLAMAHGFVKQCGGELLLYSEPGHGTTVKLLLPTASASSIPLAVANGAGTQDEDALPRGDARILVVDDEMPLLAVTASWLNDLGYAVTPCVSPASALAALGDAIAVDQPYALMVTDVIMPGMDGFALATAARALQPELALLYVSGFADASGRGQERPSGEILEKPFRQPALARQVNSALNQHRRERA